MCWRSLGRSRVIVTLTSADAGMMSVINPSITKECLKTPLALCKYMIYSEFSGIGSYSRNSVCLEGTIFKGINYGRARKHLNLPRMRQEQKRTDADWCLHVVLWVHLLRHPIKAIERGLLCFLLLWRYALSPYSRRQQQLLRTIKKRPTAALFFAFA